MGSHWENYEAPGFDELIDKAGQPRTASRKLVQYFNELSDEQIDQRRRAAELAIKQMGITFTVYSDGENIDRDWPFDIIPRVIEHSEWMDIQQGLVQRLIALNMFIDDLYNDQNCIRDGIVPEDLLDSSKNFLPELRGIKPKHGVWAHICGSDLVRDIDGTIYVLEDNLRVPSGVSYMIENREIMKRTVPELFNLCNILPVDDYTANLRAMLSSLSDNPNPTLCVLTPGVFNSAYFEHTYLAQSIGATLVEGRDLVVLEDDCVYVRNVEGFQKVDVIYRRVDDAFIDPECFNKESTLGVAGLMRAWRAGNVAIANAPGAGVADDKVIYAYVPELIRYYLDQEPMINNVPTYRCGEKDQQEHVLANLDKLVVKPANESGGYGMLIGPQSTLEEQEECRDRILADPRNYIAQPTLAISTSPTLYQNDVAARHVDLRPFVLQGEHVTVTTGGLTRVALVPGSLIVNSSQGGGSKDTWIVDTRGEVEPEELDTPVESQSQSQS